LEALGETPVVWLSKNVHVIVPPGPPEAVSRAAEQ
jgi:hypothetical protein